MSNHVLASAIRVASYLPDESDSEIAINLVAEREGAEHMVISCSAETASLLFEQLKLALADIAAQNPTAVSAPPQPTFVEQYGAEWQETDQGPAVLVLLAGQGQRLLGALAPKDARRLAALLQVAAEPPVPGPANKPYGCS